MLFRGIRTTFLRASGEAILGTQRYFSKGIRLHFTLLGLKWEVPRVSQFLQLRNELGPGFEILDFLSPDFLLPGRCMYT